MFDLEAAISDWKRQVESRWSGDRSAIAELEDHLRSEFAALVQCGHSESEAWGMANAKLGEPSALGQEFAKLAPLPMWDRAAIALILGTAALVVGAIVILFAIRGRGMLDQPLLLMHVVTITLGYMIGLLAAAVGAYEAIRRFVGQTPLPALRRTTLRVVRIASVAAVALTVLGFALGAVWAGREWGRPFGADPREIGAILVAIYFLGAAVMSWRRAMPEEGALTIAICGGGLILAAWVGAAAHVNGYPALATAIGIGGPLASICLAATSLGARRIPA